MSAAPRARSIGAAIGGSPCSAGSPPYGEAQAQSRLRALQRESGPTMPEDWQASDQAEYLNKPITLAGGATGISARSLFAAALRAARDCLRAGAGDCVREHGEPVAGAIGVAPQGARGTAVARRGTLAPGSPAAGRKHHAVDDSVHSVGPGDRALGQPRHRRDALDAHAGRRHLPSHCELFMSTTCVRVESIATMARLPQRAITRPASAPIVDSMMLSTSNWRTRRQRPAPSDSRTASSLRRDTDCASNRFAMFAHAIVSTSPTIASST